MSCEEVGKQLQRLRMICLSLPEATERLSHGEPTFFVRNKVFAMFANNHHGDGRVAVWLPVPMGVQEILVEGDPQTYFKPPYVGVRGWVGIRLEHIGDEMLMSFLHEAWALRAPKRLRESLEAKEGTANVTA
jgi:hypothetical protein